MSGARARRAGSGGGRAGVGGRSCAGSRTPASRSSRRGSGACYFETRGVERLYGGLQAALRRALAAVGCGLGPARGRGRASLRRARGGERRRAGAGRSSSPTTARTRVPRAAAARPAPARARRRRASCASSACAGSDSLRRCPALRSPSVSGRTAGAPGRSRAGAGERRVRGRRPPAEIVEALEFPEAVGNELTLRRALGGARRAGARPARPGGPVRAQARALGAARRRRLLAAHGDAARAGGRARPDPHRARAEARRAARAGARAAARARRADRGRRAPARARPARREPSSARG